MSEYDIFFLKIFLLLTNFLLLSGPKSGEGIKELIYTRLNSFGLKNRRCYSNDSYSWFSLSIDARIYELAYDTVPEYRTVKNKVNLLKNPV
jgi:hypothetical protein